MRKNTLEAIKQFKIVFIQKFKKLTDIGKPTTDIGPHFSRSLRLDL